VATSSSSCPAWASEQTALAAATPLTSTQMPAGKAPFTKRQGGQMATLNEKQAALFTGRNWGVIATIREDGSPQATPVWIDYDGENVLVNSAHGRTKVKNVERDPRATVTVLPAEDQQSGYVMVSGTARVVEEGALEHINMLAKKYLGEDKYPYLGPGEKRVIIEIHPERVDGFGAGG
jgi:PPOX class probable F420-dependent enzyme